MENQRSRGVTIFAWLIIALSFLNLLSRVEYMYRVTSKGFPLGIGDYFYLIISIFSIIFGIFLLKLKNWARLATIVISIIVFIDVCLKVPGIVKNIQLGPIFVILLLFISVPLIFEAGVVYFFTRPTVQGQFAGK